MKASLDVIHACCATTAAADAYRLGPAWRRGHLDGVDDAVAVAETAPVLFKRRVVPRAHEQQVLVLADAR